MLVCEGDAGLSAWARSTSPNCTQTVNGAHHSIICMTRWGEQSGQWCYPPRGFWALSVDPTCTSSWSSKSVLGDRDGDRKVRP